ncbi:hypothetical protein VaNZ11_009971 [Volvox africanus]|uniref:Ribonuclease n=1 Tax=Volvox africanus TaxID=51714 RepID=A0ABQ5SA67_9CHLO|nr:hypothetical protein VaNZ11_009971 [Volvox africanus]
MLSKFKFRNDLRIVVAEVSGHGGHNPAMSSPTRPRSSSHRRATSSAKKLDHSQLRYDEPITGGAEVDTQLTIPAGRSGRNRRADPPPQPQQLQAKLISPVQVWTEGGSRKQLQKKKQLSREAAAVAAEEVLERKVPIAGAGEEVNTEEGAAGERRVKVTSAIAVETRRGRKRAGAATAAASAPDKASQKQKLPFDGYASSGNVVGSHQAGGGDADLNGGKQEGGEKGTAAVDPPAKRPRGPAAKRPGRSGTTTGASTSRPGPSRDMETQLLAQGYVAVGGADEAGRGPLAGPVVAAVVVLPPASGPSWSPPHGLNDSKAMTEEEREAVYEQLTTDPRVIWTVSVVDHEEIDRINILQAALGAMRQSAVQLLQQQQQQQPVLDFLLVDGNRMPKGLPVPAQTVVKGDAKVSCIAAASCIAKVTRDRLMLKLDKQYPQYGFAQHKGYGVPAHMEAIRKHGPSAVHRRSFEPVKSMTGWSREAALAAEAAEAASANPKQNATVGSTGGAEPAEAVVNNGPGKAVRGRRDRPSKREPEGGGEGGAPGGANPPSPPRAISRRGRPRTAG